MDNEWNIPNELRILERLDELYLLVEHCPDSAMLPIWTKSIAILEAKLAGKPYQEAPYVGYSIYECPRVPTAHGAYIGKTPDYQQALGVYENARKIGKSYFIKGILADGTEVLFL